MAGKLIDEVLFASVVHVFFAVNDEFFNEGVEFAASFSSNVQNFSVVEHHDPDDGNGDDEKRNSDCQEEDTASGSENQSSHLFENDCDSDVQISSDSSVQTFDISFQV